jgi:uncharacterized protein YegL
MKKDLTELVFILDRSGSMHGLEADTVGGFNSFIEKQKDVDGECLVSTVLFNSRSEVLYDRIPLREIPEMTRKEYVPSGSTALIDAMGDAIHHIRNVHKYIRKEDVPEHTIFVIITDGQENDSHRYSSDEVKKMVSQQKEKDWEFLFLGANIDAVETAKHYGISADRATNYVCDAQGTEVNYKSLSKAVGKFRKAGVIQEDWDAEICADYEARK